MKKYLATSILFLFNDELVSIIALLIMTCMFIWEIAVARSNCHNQ